MADENIVENDSEHDVDEVETDSQYEESVEDEQDLDTEEGTEESEDENDEQDDESENDEVVFEEVEYNGAKYSVPAELKAVVENVANFESEQTQFIEKRQEFEQQAQMHQQSLQAQAQNVQHYAQLANIDSQLNDYANVDWNQFTQDDPTMAQQAWMQQEQLKVQRNQVVGTIQQNEAKFQETQQAQFEQVKEKGLKVLQEKIPNWGKEKSEALVGFSNEYGFQENEIRGILDPRMIQVLHDAYLYKQSLKKATEKPVKKVQPVKKVKGKSKTRIDPDKLSTEDWLKQRRKEIAKKTL